MAIVGERVAARQHEKRRGGVVQDRLSTLSRLGRIEWDMDRRALPGGEQRGYPFRRAGQGVGDAATADNAVGQEDPRQSITLRIKRCIAEGGSADTKSDPSRRRRDVSPDAREHGVCVVLWARLLDPVNHRAANSRFEAGDGGRIQQVTKAHAMTEFTLNCERQPHAEQ